MNRIFFRFFFHVAETPVSYLRVNADGYRSYRARQKTLLGVCRAMLCFRRAQPLFMYPSNVKKSVWPLAIDLSILVATTLRVPEDGRVADRLAAKAGKI